LMGLGRKRSRNTGEGIRSRLYPCPRPHPLADQQHNRERVRAG
jgi:hypothetical protein